MLGEKMYRQSKSKAESTRKHLHSPPGQKVALNLTLCLTLVKQKLNKRLRYFHLI